MGRLAGAKMCNEFDAAVKFHGAVVVHAATELHTDKNSCCCGGIGCRAPPHSWLLFSCLNPNVTVADLSIGIQPFPFFRHGINLQTHLQNLMNLQTCSSDLRFNLQM